MAKFLVFTYYAGRPLGGMLDYLDSFPTIESALENILEEPERYFQVVDRESMQVLREGLALYKDFVSTSFEKAA
jgi:hypothetical protein